MGRKSSFEKGTQDNIEKFTSLAAGAIDTSGALLPNSYDLQTSMGQDTGAPHFADMVAEGGDHLKEYVEQPKSTGLNLRPMERLHRIQGKALMPRTSLSVTAYNVNVANPSSYKFMVNTPRVGNGALKGINHQFFLSQAIRGDVPINHHPNVCLINKSRFGRDSQNLSGLFTPHFNALYNKYTGKAFRNLVTKISGAGDKGHSETIMDHY